MSSISAPIRAVMLGLLLTSMVAACGHNDEQRYGQIDSNERTMAVPPGGNWLLTNLKNALVRDGWKLTVNVGQTVSGEVGAQTSLAIRPSSPARYQLRVSARQLDYCIIGRPKLAYDVSLIDIKTSEEVLTVAGVDDCLGADPATRVMNAIRAISG